MTERDIFIAALQKKDRAGRQAYLDEACRAQPHLREQVEHLLRLYEGAGSFLENPAVESAVTGAFQEAAELAASLEGPGTSVGPYKLIEQIGEGGMGTVWMAQQLEPVKRLVAVKLIKAGMDSKQVIARFEAERQALALMDHVNIARVLDAGMTGTGRPYFVMDLVRGVPITKYCDEHHLTPRQRLELFIPVCQAIQHAHQKGIIHRDLKPSNALIALYDSKPVPKIIDFGVAKAAGQQLTDKTLVTGFGAIVGTLEYMSPEQAEVNQLDIDTRSDVYSLGVLLYELLAGSPPFSHQELQEAGMLEMLRVIREQEPSKPSTKLSTAEGLPTLAANRGTEPAKLTKLLRGELDWIVMKALEKDRNRRYETANSFARDVERYLNDEHVLACPASVAYRFRKFARRRKTALVMAACVLLSLAGVAGGVGWAVRDKAAREDTIKLDRMAREKALSQVVERNLDEAGPLVEDGKWPEALTILERTEQILAAAAWTERPARLLELNKAVAIAQRLDRIYQGPRRSDQPRRLLSSIQGSTHEAPLPQDVYDEAFFTGRQQDADFAEAFHDLGIDVETLSADEAAAKIRPQSIRTALVRALDGWAPFRKRSRGEGDPLWKKLIDIARQADGDEWRNRCREAGLKGDRRALEQLADAVPIRRTRPESLYLLGQTLRDVGAVDKALTLLERAQHEYPGDLWLNDALAHHSRSVCQPPRWDAALRYYAAVLALRPDFSPIHVSVGDALKATGATDGALLEYSKAVELEPKSVIVWTIRGSFYRSLGRYEEAFADYSKAIELESNNGAAWHLRSLAHLETGQYDGALADANQAVETFRRRVELERGPTQATLRVELGHSLWHLARILALTSKRAEAETTLREALKVFENLASEYPQERYYRLETAYTLRQLFFDVWRAANRTDEAVEAMRRAIDLYGALVAEEPRDEFYRSELALTCYDLANYLRALQRATEAERYFQQALHVRRTLVDEAPTNDRRLALALTHNALASLYLDAHRLGEAEEAFRASVENYSKLVSEATFAGAVPWHLGDTCCWLAVILRNTGRAKEASELCRQVAQECRSAVARQKQLVNASNLSSDRSDLAGSLESFARVLNELHEAPEAECCYRDALCIRQKLVADSNTAADRFLLGVVHGLLGELLGQRGRTEEAVESHQASRAIRAQLVAEFNHEDHRNHLAWTNERLGDLHDAAGRLDDGAAAYREAAEVWEKLATDFPQNTAYRDQHCNRLNALANLYIKYGHLEEADQVLTKAVEKWPNQAAALRSRGELYARWILLPEAAADSARAYELEEPRDSLACVAHALLRAYMGDVPRYRNACRRMLERFADSTNPEDWNHVAQTLTILPDSQAEPSRAVDLAERAVGDRKAVWRVAFLGLSLFRVKEFERAVAALEQSLAIDANWNPPWVHSALAMAWHQLGSDEQAAAALAKAVSARDQRIEHILAGGGGQWPCLWFDAVYAELLYREAHALLHGSPPPEDPRLLVLQGRGLDAIGRSEEARAAFDRAFALGPDSLAICVAALPHVDRSDAFAAGLANLRELVQKHPGQTAQAGIALARAHLRLGRKLHELKRQDEAESILALIDNLAPASSDVFLERGQFWLELNQRDNALADVSKAIGLEPTNVAGRLQRAKIYGAAGRKDSALADAMTAVELLRGRIDQYKGASQNPGWNRDYSELAAALESLAHLIDALGAPQETENLYRDAHAIWRELVAAEHPSGVGPREGLGHSYRFLAMNAWNAGNTKEAVDLFTEAVDVFGKLCADYPNVPAYAHFQADTHRRIGLLLALRKQFREAEKAHRLSIEIHRQRMARFPDQPVNQFEVGFSYSDLAALLVTLSRESEADDMLREATAAYAKVIEVEPVNAITYNGLAWVYATCPALDLRDPAKAVALAKKAIELRPSGAANWNTLGVAQYRAGDWKAATAALTKSMELRGGGDSFDWFFLAMAHWRLGQMDDARKWRKQAVEWMETHKPHDAELLRFRAEAEEMLETDPPASSPQRPHSEID